MGAAQDLSGSVKLSRADAVKLVAAELQASASVDAEQAEQKVIDARRAFKRAVIGYARRRYELMLTDIATAVGSPMGVHGNCIYNVYADGSNTGSVAEVVFADDERAYESKARVAVQVPLDDEAKRLRDDWLRAIRARDAAAGRDTRVGAMTKEARDQLIKAALSGSAEGQEVLRAVKALADKVRKDA